VLYRVAVSRLARTVIRRYWGYIATKDAVFAPVPPRFREALAKTHGNRLDRVVLFGSRARRDARPDSDYDVAVFFKRDTHCFWLGAAGLIAIAAKSLFPQPSTEQ
jgi:uncharacterized protein